MNLNYFQHGSRLATMSFCMWACLSCLTSSRMRLWAHARGLCMRLWAHAHGSLHCHTSPEARGHQALSWLSQGPLPDVTSPTPAVQLNRTCLSWLLIPLLSTLKALNIPSYNHLWLWHLLWPVVSSKAGNITSSHLQGLALPWGLDECLQDEYQ